MTEPMTGRTFAQRLRHISMNLRENCKRDLAYAGELEHYADEIETGAKSEHVGEGERTAFMHVRDARGHLDASRRSLAEAAQWFGDDNRGAGFALAIDLVDALLDHLVDDEAPS